MKMKIIGILVCMLLIITALSATGVTNVQTIQYVNENKDLEPYLSTPANSPGIITIKIVAKVEEIHDPYNLLGGAIQVGDTITGKYTYESGQPDSDPDPTLGIYEYTSSTFGVEFKAGGLVFKTNPGNVVFEISIGNDHPYWYDIYDHYLIYSQNNLQLSNGMLVKNIYWSLSDSTCTALSSDALPTTAPILSDWESNLLYINGDDPVDPLKNYNIGANVTEATKSRARDVYFISQPILNWFFEHFANMFPMLRHLLGL